MSHFKNNAKSYGPALSPILFLFLGVLVLMGGIIFEKAGVFLEKEINAAFIFFVKLAVWGFGPLLILSYTAFHIIARPVATLLRRCLPSVHRILYDMLTGSVYGVIMGACISMCLKPTSLPGAISILLFGIIMGISNWLFYKKLAGDTALPMTSADGLHRR